MQVLQKFSLCPACGECPELAVVRTDDGRREVRLTEDGREFTLSAKAWNDLVARVRSGEVAPI
jgi:hypothetical protein